MERLEPMQAEDMPSQPQSGCMEEDGLVKAEKSVDPEFVLSTKNLERVREELRQEEIMKELKAPLKSEPASPTKAEVLVIPSCPLLSACIVLIFNCF